LSEIGVGCLQQTLAIKIVCPFWQDIALKQREIYQYKLYHSRTKDGSPFNSSLTIKKVVGNFGFKCSERI